jgi:hypothetical protein
LDHPPNYQGLTSVLDSLAQRQVGGLDIRLIGGPPAVGTAIAKAYPSVTYLGALDDHELAKEASSWNAFLNPVFCFGRGCSTKLAIALQWQIPIVTTLEGCRGYVWEKGDLVRTSSVEEFADWVHRLTDMECASSIRDQVVQVTLSSPNIAEIGSALRRVLLNPAEPGDWITDRSRLVHADS